MQSHPLGQWPWAGYHWHLYLSSATTVNVPDLEKQFEKQANKQTNKKIPFHMNSQCRQDPKQDVSHLSPVSAVEKQRKEEELPQEWKAGWDWEWYALGVGYCIITNGEISLESKRMPLQERMDPIKELHRAFYLFNGKSTKWQYQKKKKIREGMQNAFSI